MKQTGETGDSIGQARLMDQSNIECPTSSQSNPNIAAARREYRRQYYLKNRERAREYQREYNVRHRKKLRQICNFCIPRKAIKRTFTASDIMQASTEKALKILTMILRGERDLAM